MTKLPIQNGEDYDYFVSYYENVADDYAERVYKVLHGDLGCKVYVNHIIRGSR
jgi:hypothetical protein